MKKIMLSLIMTLLILISGCLGTGSTTTYHSNATDLTATGITETGPKCDNSSLLLQIGRLKTELNELNNSLKQCRENGSILMNSLNLTRSRLSELSMKYGKCVARISDLNQTAENLAECRHKLEETEDRLSLCEVQKNSLLQNLTSCRNSLNKTYVDGSFELLTDRAYYEEVLKEINDATESIYVMMFSMLYDPEDSYDEANDLIRALVRAEYRGVDVHVLLDDGVDYNRVAYNYLRSNGVDVAFDSPETTLHAKVVIIDGKIVFMGSHNWSESALHWNHEVSVKIVSRDLARSLISYFWSIRNS
ncbi:phospholipase D-like domain-containing protein [Thermococcus sp.]